MVNKFIDEFCRTADFIPTLVVQFTTTIPSSILIEVWDITHGVNILLVLIDDTVQQIGNTKSWFWSMINMPSDKSADGHFLIRMTANTNEIIEREVVVRTIADGNWKF